MDNLNDYILERIRIDNIKSTELEEGEYFELPFDVDWTITIGGNKIKLPKKDWYVGVIKYGKYHILIFWNKLSKWTGYIDRTLIEISPDDPNRWWRFFYDENHQQLSPKSFFDLVKDHFGTFLDECNLFGVNYINIDKNTEDLMEQFKNKFDK